MIRQFELCFVRCYAPGFLFKFLYNVPYLKCDVMKQNESEVVGNDLLLVSEVLFHLNVSKCQCSNQTVLLIHVYSSQLQANTDVT